MSKKITLFFALMLGVACLGCNQTKLPDGMPNLVSWKVKVTQESKPLEGARVEFKGAKAAYVIEGITDAQGIAVMKTNGQYPGVPADDYTAAVTKEVLTLSKFEGVIPNTEAEREQQEKERAKEYRPTHCYVNKKFGKFETSGLKASVTAAGESAFEVGAAVDDIVIPPGTAKKP